MKQIITPSILAASLAISSISFATNTSNLPVASANQTTTFEQVEVNAAAMKNAQLENQRQQKTAELNSIAQQAKMTQEQTKTMRRAGNQVRALANPSLSTSAKSTTASSMKQVEDSTTTPVPQQFNVKQEAAESTSQILQQNEKLVSETRLPASDSNNASESEECPPDAC